MNSVDWAPFEGLPENECECRCGRVFRSHAKVVGHLGSLAIFTRHPCPGCRRDDGCRRISSDPEPFVL